MELDSSKDWARHHLKCRTIGGKGVAAVVHAEAELPLAPLAAFQLMAHPDNAAIFRGIERCTYRKVVWAASDTGPADGRQTIEVENESGESLRLASLTACMPPPCPCRACIQLFFRSHVLGQQQHPMPPGPFHK